jgi:hypothetical protein
MLNEEREEQRMMMTMSELVVVLRDARGMREERALRVSARFDDQERVSVSISSFDFRECIPIKREFFFVDHFLFIFFDRRKAKELFYARRNEALTISTNDLLYAILETGEAVDASAMERNDHVQAHGSRDETNFTKRGDAEAHCSDVFVDRENERGGRR